VEKQPITRQRIDPDTAVAKALDKALQMQFAKCSNLQVVEAKLCALGKGSTTALAEEIGLVRVSIEDGASDIAQPNLTGPKL
jgi:L-rhamnose isomerase